MTDLSRIRDVEGEKERKKEEREGEKTPSPIFLQSLIQETTKAVIAALIEQGFTTTPTDQSVASPKEGNTNTNNILTIVNKSEEQSRPTASSRSALVGPPNEPCLPDTPLALWQCDSPSVSQRDRYRLEMLCNEFNLMTDGFGAYWVGRAILMADQSFGDNAERKITINYVRAILRRWSLDGSWGSDATTFRSTEIRIADHNSGNQANTLRIASAEGDRTVIAPATTDLASQAPEMRVDIDQEKHDTAFVIHPAIQAYINTFGQTPSIAHVQLITNAISDMQTWNRVLTEWKANNWKSGSISGMIDRYCREMGVPNAIASAKTTNISEIYDHPDLTSEERGLWIRRFHNATTQAEKRNVILRMRQKHPYPSQDHANDNADDTV
ncbi:MAG: hypothetical protein EI684_07020 [Candidatus Viridilinea halotolerans]|uniref:DnaD domain protein n=1 Tax=Candidatus Viridilinea halotolerans TaxID=2491704 RepID=A0A426U3N9_9CHLR|nr:MAG: hypothetical protein EI684_07020 [Candidatus Viridilinea halotolerans]